MARSRTGNRLKHHEQMLKIRARDVITIHTIVGGGYQDAFMWETFDAKVLEVIRIRRCKEGYGCTRHFRVTSKSSRYITFPRAGRIMHEYDIKAR